MDNTPERIDSKFRFILLAAQRAEQIIQGAARRLEEEGTKPINIAQKEIQREAVAWDYGPPPAPPEPEEAEAGEAGAEAAAPEAEGES